MLCWVPCQFMFPHRSPEADPSPFLESPPAPQKQHCIVPPFSGGTVQAMKEAQALPSPTAPTHLFKCALSELAGSFLFFLSNQGL